MTIIELSYSYVSSIIILNYTAMLILDYDQFTTCVQVTQYQSDFERWKRSLSRDFTRSNFKVFRMIVHSTVCNSIETVMRRFYWLIMSYFEEGVLYGDLLVKDV
jgi:hypothetical protein